MKEVSIESLLLKKESKSKMLLAFIGLVLGLVSVLFSVQLYVDINEVLQENKSNSKFEYLQVNKKIGYGNTLGLTSSNFKKKEISRLKKKPFIQDVGAVKSNDFKVSIEGGVGIPFYTELFLQAVPNKFIDVDTSNFRWESEDQEVPLIVSTHFFNLYNHGFAPSQGLPSLPKSALKKKSFTLTLRGDKGRKKLKCRIYDYSDRISSILVPNEFLNWANESFMNRVSAEVNMLILEVEDTGDARLKKYLKKKGYSVNKERLSMDNTKMVLTSVLYVFVSLGIVVLLLSVMQIISFSKLVIVQNEYKISVLSLLGYSTSSIAKALFKSYLKVILLSVLVVIPVATLLLYLLYNFLGEFNFEVSMVSVETLLVFVLVVGSTLLLINVNIFQYLKKRKSIEK